MELFFSYAHGDEKLRDELAKQLKLLERQGVISLWHDRRIAAGDEWKGAIDAHLEAAAIILLLVSPDFMASDYCWDVELERAMARHAAGEARVIPVILRPCDWMSAPFGKLQALPRDAKPVTSWGNRDEAFLDVARGIRQVAEATAGRAGSAGAARAGGAPARRPLDYRKGLDDLKARLQAQQPAAVTDFLVLEARLRENLDGEARYGATETSRAERARIVDVLNRLALAAVGVSFNDLCS